MGEGQDWRRGNGCRMRKRKRKSMLGIVWFRGGNEYVWWEIEE